LKTKVKAQFNRTVTERSKPFFYRFCQSNRCHFAGHFTLVTLGRRIDRQWVAPKLPSILPKAGGQSPERSQRGAAQPRVERSKSAKPTLRPSAYIFQPATPPGSFPFLLQRKHFLNSTLGWPLGDPCVTLGWRLRDPTPIPSICRGLQLQLWPIANCQVPFALFSKSFAHRTLGRRQILGDF
jgi:hypothetical protein